MKLVAIKVTDDDIERAKQMRSERDKLYGNI